MNSLEAIVPQHARVSTRKRAADGSRSIFDAPTQTAQHVWRAHVRGVVAGVYGYLLSLAKRDPELFAFPSLEMIRNNAIPYELLKSRDSYSSRSVFHGVRLLLTERVIVRAFKFRRGAARHGWIVLPHESWCVDVPGIGGMLMSNCEGYRDFMLDRERTGRTERARKSYHVQITELDEAVTATREKQTQILGSVSPR